MHEQPRARLDTLATVVLYRSGPCAAFWVVGLGLCAAVLLPLGWWHPAVVLPLSLVLALAAARLGALLPVGAPSPGRGAWVTPRWAALATVAVAAGFALWWGVTHSEHVVLRRDAGSYALFAQWIGSHHGLPVQARLAAFGGPTALQVPGFTLESPAYYQVLHGSGAAAGADVVPQFLLGAPALYSIGWWLAGWNGLLLAPALVGGVAVLAAGGVTGRLVGPRWAPLGALLLGLTQPVTHVARSTYSEPLALLLVLAAAALAVGAVAAGAPSGSGERGSAPPATLPAGDPAAARRLGLAAGALLGLAALVRVDSLREVVLLFPFCAALAIRRHPAAGPLALGATLGTALAAVPALALSGPYLHTVSDSLVPLVKAGAALAVASLLAVGAGRWWQRRGGDSSGAGAGDGAAPSRVLTRARRVLPWLAVAGVLVAGAVLASRPWWQVSRQLPANDLVASLQQQQGLAVDGARTYAEQSVRWVAWYTGAPALVGAWLVLALAAGRATGWLLAPRARSLPVWLLPVGVGLGSTLLTLYRPGITPDHPWADRRLVPVVLPVVVLSAVAAAAAGFRFARRRFPASLLVATHAVLMVALLVPAVVATAPLAIAATERGSVAAVRQVCAQLRPGDVVVAVDDPGGENRAGNEWVQVVRGVCGLPSAAVNPDAAGARDGTDPAAPAGSLARLGELVRAAGGRMVLLSAGADDDRARAVLTRLGVPAHRAVYLRTREDPRWLQRRPGSTTALVIDVWLGVWPGPAGR